MAVLGEGAFIDLTEMVPLHSLGLPYSGTVDKQVLSNSFTK